MKIKKTTQYAIQIIGYIYNKDEDIVTSNVISEAENIPHGVLMKVLRKLTAAGMVRSHQGRGKICGGFSLNTGLNQITLYELMRIMDEDICRSLGDCKTTNSESRRMFAQLNHVEAIIKAETDKYTLYEIIKGHLPLNGI